MTTVLDLSEAIAPADFRQVLGHFVTGVTVVTAIVDDCSVGMCVNSFASLSLDPPLVLFAAAQGSSTWPILREADGITINILGDEQADLARCFATKGADRFAGLTFDVSPYGGVVLDGCLAHLDCHLEQLVPGGDHEIAICRVVAMSAPDARRPLAFYSSAFGTFFEGDG